MLFIHPKYIYQAFIICQVLCCAVGMELWPRQTKYMPSEFYVLVFSSTGFGQLLYNLEQTVLLFQASVLPPVQWVSWIHPGPYFSSQLITKWAQIYHTVQTPKFQAAPSWGQWEWAFPSCSEQSQMVCLGWAYWLGSAPYLSISGT